MPIKISPKLRNAIATDNGISKDEVEIDLKAKSGGRCFLCDGEFNYASDDIEVDHDSAVDAGGSNLLSNVNLAHVECNRFKKAQGSKDVRSMLKFKRFYNSKGGSLDYNAALEFFGVTPKASVYEEKKGNAYFEFSNGSKASATIHKSEHGEKEHAFCFVPVPIEAVFNDDECQPRLIKLNHVFSIATDLTENPLHEPPACRIVDMQNGTYRVLMFDGQHKALANWLRHEKSIVFKIYLNMNRSEATGLVNSIQSKIKKLPLTPFELASKLSDEYRDKLAIYEESVGAEECSESGFVASLPQSDRASAKKEIESAVLQEIADESTLLITQLVEMRGRKLTIDWKISETSFQKKLLKELAHTGPLPASRFKGNEMQVARLRERQNIVRCLNALYEKVYDDLNENSSFGEKEKARRMSYQSSLKYVASLLKKIVINRMPPTEDALVFIEKSPTDEQWNLISDGIERVINHPVWTDDLNGSKIMKDVSDALQKNQGVDLAMQAAGLTPGYCLRL